MTNNKFGRKLVRKDKTRCRMSGCRRVAQTHRPACDGQCQPCYLSSVGVPVSDNAKEARCPFCEVLLRYVRHDGGVCNYQRCRTEAQQLREERAKEGAAA